MNFPLLPARNVSRRNECRRLLWSRVARRTGPGLVLVLALVSNVVWAADPIRVACVGDSITQGVGASSPYPLRLGRLLGPAYQVRNYGVSGTTLLKRGDLPYWNQSAYTTSHTWNPQIVVIKLGSNDSKPQNWRYGTNFVSDYLELIGTYTALTSTPAIYLCTPCPVVSPGAFGITPSVVATSVVPAIRLVADAAGLPIIDVHSAMLGHSEWLPDTVHPNDAGAAVLAAVVYAGLREPPGPGAPEAKLSVASTLPNRVHLSWPEPYAGFLLEQATVITMTNIRWTVVDRLLFNDGASMSLSNQLPSGGLRLYRLRDPVPK